MPLDENIKMRFNSLSIILYKELIVFVFLSFLNQFCKKISQYFNKIAYYLSKYTFRVRFEYIFASYRNFTSFSSALTFVLIFL